MPNPESAAAFDKLVTARTRLNTVATQMKHCLDRGESMTAAYRALQRAWDNAIIELETATEDYSKAVKNFREKSEAAQREGESN